MKLVDNPMPLFANEQYRMCKLQVYNWGTFSGAHTVPIAPAGHLFVGRSGAGKSTLLDAFSALLVPPRWVDFNAAAREADRSGRDRSLVSYVRGAWAEQKSDESGEFATKYLRPGTTWSAIGLTYQNTAGQFVVLVQVIWIRGSSSNSADLKRQYLVVEREFDLTELDPFGQSNLDVRKLKQMLPEAFIRDEFRPYAERFCRLLGINSELALRLLHKTQSAKNLGDLNVFLRDFMLDKPETFEVADRLVSEFAELNAAHQAVVTAREQVEILLPARLSHQQMQQTQLSVNCLREEEAGLEAYTVQKRLTLLKSHLEQVAQEKEGAEQDAASQKNLLDNQNDTLRDLERQHRELGGDQIEQWESERRGKEELRNDCLRRRDQAAEACKALEWALPDTPELFAQLVSTSRSEMEQSDADTQGLREEQMSLRHTKQLTETAFLTARREVDALRAQSSNIPSHMLDLRAEIAQGLGISKEALPFAGELLEVKQDEQVWQGAIERVLHNFALSLLVDERHYAALTSYLNERDLRQRLVYHRTTRPSDSLNGTNVRALSNQSLILKLTVKECGQSDWLKQELRNRFDYACVETVSGLRSVPQGITREGQIRHSTTRHEKDDRHSIHDRRRWVLGFDNREKLALFQQEAQHLADEILKLDARMTSLRQQENRQISRIRYCQTLANFQWQDIDIMPLLQRISDLDTLIRNVRAGNVALRDIAARIQSQQAIVASQDLTLRQAQVKSEKLQAELTQTRQRLTDTQSNTLCFLALTPTQADGLSARFENFEQSLTLDSLEGVARKVISALKDEQAKLEKEISSCSHAIERQFVEFKRKWPADAGDMDTTLASANDYFAKLIRLETDGLPQHEHRFFDLLQSQSHQNLAALSTYLNDARKGILERMELVNESLRQVPFNHSDNLRTHLQIETTDRQLPEVKEFRQHLQLALSNAWSDDRALGETRFLALKQLVERLSSQDPEKRRWRESVLDVRQHIEFVGYEKDEGDLTVETYRSGSGKSGGQRQKLATTCLAAALRYQLGGAENGVPMYAPVILDEAFDKADNEFTALAMNIFKNFGFQMIVATPLKSVMTLEPFIGGACFVDIQERKVSSVLSIEYDETANRLMLPKRTEAGESEAA